jgi:signal peptidase I
MRRILATLAVVALLFGAGATLANDTSEANKLFVEAVKLVNSVESVENPFEKADALEEALVKLNKIVDDYPSSNLAVKLISGQDIGSISLKAVGRSVERWAESAHKMAESIKDDSVLCREPMISDERMSRASFATTMYIPSGGMLPTLHVNDIVRFATVESVGLLRGDVALFKLPRDNKTNYVKRIVGLPGDRIQVKDGLLYVNDVPIERNQIKNFTYDDVYGRSRSIAQFEEKLPNGAVHHTLDANFNGNLDNTDVYSVPERHFFVMGDNRDNSLDSRIDNAYSGVGFVPVENFFGVVTCAMAGAEAVKWIRMAAEQGFAQAQYKLGLTYARGLGVDPPNFVRAYMWFSLAKAQGDESAAKALDIIENQMNPFDISKTLALAQELAAKKFGPSSAEAASLATVAEAQRGIYDTAILEWHPLAEQGDRLAMLRLADAYGSRAAMGGPSEDWRMAYYWTFLAGTFLGGEGTLTLNYIAKDQLSREEIEELEQRAFRWNRAREARLFKEMDEEMERCARLDLRYDSENVLAGEYISGLCKK